MAHCDTQLVTHFLHKEWKVRSETTNVLLVSTFEKYILQTRVYGSLGGVI